MWLPRGYPGVGQQPHPKQLQAVVVVVMVVVQGLYVGVPCVQANMQQDEDKDARVIARDLFALLAANPQAKDAVAATMRSAAATAAAAPAPKTGSA